MPKINKFMLFLAVIFALFAFILSISLRGLPGTPSAKELNTSVWIEEGPLELSPERGRYALTHSVVENRSVFFSPDLAKFTLPDVGYINGKYVSLFDPGISYLTIPGYLIGRFFGAAQIGSIAVISVFALFNAWLILLITVRLGANKYLAALGGLVFLFATPAFTYAVTLYQHHVSVLLILISIYLLLRWDNFLSYGIILFLYALSFLIDYPNVVLMFPFILHMIIRIIDRGWKKDYLKLVNISKMLFILSLSFLPILLLLLFNYASYGNPLQLSGTVKTVKDIKIEAQGQSYTDSNVLVSNLDRKNLKKRTRVNEKNATSFFNEKNMINGLYIHLISPDRGIVFYAPVVLIGLLGIGYGLKKKIGLSDLFLAIIGSNILIYSLWSDPWGGWAFGSRYLIPSYALLSIYVAVSLSFARKNVWVWLVFAAVLSYSVAVNTAGALTTSKIPPRIEVAQLEKASNLKQQHTFLKNFDLLKNNYSKSYIFKTSANEYLTAWNYYLLVTSIIMFGASLLVVSYFFHKDEFTT